MPVPSSISDLSQTAGSNSPNGAIDPPNVIDDHLRAAYSFLALLRDGKGLSAEVDVASAATCDIGSANSPFVRITGTTPITSLGTNYNGPRFVRFAGALVLTNSATLVLPGGANISTAAGDSCIAIPIGVSGWQVFGYQRASTAPGTSATLATGRTISITGDLSYTSGSFDGSANVTGTGTLATVNSNTGSFGSATAIPVVTVNGKGLVIGASTTNVASVGVGQTWQDMTASRVKGTTYTNSTGKPIQILVRGGQGGDSGGDLYINGNLVGSHQSSAANLKWTHSAVIPYGSTYKVDGVFCTIASWFELR